MPVLYQTVRGTYLIRNGPPCGISPQDMMVVNTIHASTFIATGSAGMRENVGPNPYFNLGSNFMQQGVPGAYAGERMMGDMGRSPTSQLYPENAAHQFQSDMMQHLYNSADDQNGRERSARATNTNQFDTNDSRCRRFNGHFNSWHRGKVKCTFCPQMVDENQSICVECKTRVNKVKNIFSNIETVPERETGQPITEGSFKDTDGFECTLAPMDLSINKQAKKSEVPPGLKPEENDSMEDSEEEDEEDQTVGDYYDSDNENEQTGRVPEPDPPQRQDDKISPPEESQPRSPVIQQGKSNIEKVASEIQPENGQPQKLAVPSSSSETKNPKPVTPSVTLPSKGNDTTAKPQGKSGREIAVFKCPLCVKVFCQPPVLDYHLYKFHSGTVPFKCKDCKDKTFAYWKTYVIHRHIHKRRDNLMCQLCAEDFGSDEKRYISHVKCHGLPTWKCKFCPTEFAHTRKLDVHLVQCHSDKNPLTCWRNGCAKSFTSYQLLRNHLKQAHQIQEPDDTISTSALFPKANTPVNVYTEVVVKVPCEICGVKQETISDLENHMKNLHENITTVICHQCSKLVDINSMPSHVCSKETATKSFKCGICSKQFNDINLLVSHQLEHQTIMRATDKKQHIANPPQKSQLIAVHPEKVNNASPSSSSAESEDAEIAEAAASRGEKRKRIEDRSKNSTSSGSTKLPKMDQKDLNANMPNNCALCPRKCNSSELKSFIDLHNKAHRPRNPFPCPVPTCGKRFTESHHAYSHFRFAHRGIKEFVARLTLKV